MVVDEVVAGIGVVGTMQIVIEVIDKSLYVLTHCTIQSMII